MKIRSVKDALVAGLAITLFSVTSSLAITYLIGGFAADMKSVIIATIVPLIVAPIASAWSLSKTLKIHRLNEDLQYMLNHDGLTKLYSRAFFFSATHADPAPGVAVTLMVDADHFKSINDTYGHDVGDDALRHIARHLRDNCRKHDIVARLGGEEFVIYMRDTDLALGAEVANRICRVLEETPLCVGDAEIRLTVSIGLALRLGSDNIDTVLKEADEALYAAKSAGRNRVVISPRSAVLQSA